MIDWSKWARRFPFSLDVKRCGECGGVMMTETVHDKHTRDGTNPKGVEADVCQDCGHAEHKDPVPGT
ncbi:hypothetical protein HALLA_12040 [Halostagnicola larsenii XH-48]|uniref:Uncharacterized protein n=1 Tax=Halostagnicola larsenii XH-48 TaxID=797299 RepID=W0JV43_9EURY|nr:hypothetical protein [Halostagnicola larsenii]AHG00908.1 hypothetical protein HALLA_11750 [Halostagnicola larsenii XH-48]AHG00955.1 hypothetical protein HALLA_12040 [Halostagnicola larsenii XH-48]